MSELETWMDRERRLREEKERELQAKRDTREREFQKQTARLRALGCDDGKGACKYCACVLTFDTDGRAMHPDNDCSGPPPKPCTVCNKPLVLVDKRWRETCTPEEHDAIYRTRALVQSVRQRAAGHDPLSRARSARRVNDD
jgi:hypothetical protein